eukprot:SAG31_NODE_4136_length_3549_cov_13.673333_3_plen_81_part_00
MQHKQRNRPKPVLLGTAPASARRFDWVVANPQKYSKFCIIVELWAQQQLDAALAEFQDGPVVANVLGDDAGNHSPWAEIL